MRNSHPAYVPVHRLRLFSPLDKIADCLPQPVHRDCVRRVIPPKIKLERTWDPYGEVLQAPMLERSHNRTCIAEAKTAGTPALCLVIERLSLAYIICPYRSYKIILRFAISHLFLSSPFSPSSSFPLSPSLCLSLSLLRV